MQQNSKYSSPTYLQLTLAKQEILELRQSIKFLEIQFAKTKEETRLAISVQNESETKYQEVQLACDQLQQQHNNDITIIQQQETVIAQQTQQIKSYQEQLTKIQKELQQQQLQSKQEIKVLNAKIGKFTAEILQKTSEIKQNHLKITNLEDQLHQSKQANSILDQKVVDTNQTLENLINDKKVGNLLTYKIKELRAKNAKLLDYLHTIPKYQNVTDSIKLYDGEVYFKYDQMNRCVRRRCGGQSASEDWLDLIPLEAIKLIEDFKKKEDKNPLDVELRMLVRHLNEVWRQREFNHVDRLKQMWKNEVRSLRLQMNKIPSFQPSPQRPKTSISRRSASVSKKVSASTLDDSRFGESWKTKVIREFSASTAEIEEFQQDIGRTVVEGLKGILARLMHRVLLE